MSTRVGAENRFRPPWAAAGLAFAAAAVLGCGDAACWPVPEEPHAIVQIEFADHAANIPCERALTRNHHAQRGNAGGG